MKLKTLNSWQIYGLILVLITTSWAVNRQFTEQKRFNAKEAHQGVAVDKSYFYAIDSGEIGKYNKNGCLKAENSKKKDRGNKIMDHYLRSLNYA